MNKKKIIIGLLLTTLLPLSAQTAERGLKECIRIGIERNLGLKNARIMRHIDFDDLWKNHLFDYKDGDLLVIDDITRLILSDYENTTLAFVMAVFCVEGHISTSSSGRTWNTSMSIRCSPCLNVNDRDSATITSC